MHCWKLITGSSEPEKLLEINLQVLKMMYTCCIHMLYTYIQVEMCTGDQNLKYRLIAAKYAAEKELSAFES